MHFNYSASRLLWIKVRTDYWMNRFVQLFLFSTGYPFFWILAKCIVQMEEQVYQNVTIRLAVTFVIPDTRTFRINPVNLC